MGYDDIDKMLAMNGYKAVKIEDFDNLLAACKMLLEALVWAGGSNDFAPEGQAHKGWVMVARPAIDAGYAAVAKIDGEINDYPRP